MKSSPIINTLGKYLPVIARFVIVIPMLYIMLSLTMNSFLHTTGMEIVHNGEEVSNVVNEIPAGWETVVYYNDDLLANIFWLGVFLLLTVVLVTKVKNIKFKYLVIFVFLWTFIIGCIWVNSSMVAPTEDSMMVTDASEEFANNDYAMLSDESRYFKNYSFQLGYVFLNEIFIRIYSLFVDYRSFIFLQVINVFFLALAYVGIQLINNRIFDDRRIDILTALFLTASIAPIISATFLYGIIPGFCFGIWGIYFMFLFFDSEKTKAQIISGILSVLFLMTAVMIKTNNMIIVVAAVGMSVVNMVKKGRLLPNIVYMITAVILCNSISSAVVSMYEHRSGVDLGEPVPFVSWFSLGMNEAKNAPGWYNVNATVGNYMKNNYIPSRAKRSSKEHIKERLEYFKENPQYARDFFYKKFVSQWNETSYQSIWNNKVRDQYEDKKALANFVCNKHEKGVKRYMDIYAQFIFFAVFVGLLYLLKDKNFNKTIFPLIILGGVLYHIMAEAKSQYAMPYFILMSGFAAYGLCRLYDMLAEKYGQTKFFKIIGRI